MVQAQDRYATAALHIQAVAQVLLTPIKEEKGVGREHAWLGHHYLVAQAWRGRHEDDLGTRMKKDYKAVSQCHLHVLTR